MNKETEDSCDRPLWKLIDSSPANSAQPPIVSTTRNFTVYFGQAYSITKLGLIMGQADETPSDVIYYPQIGIISSEKQISPESEKTLNLTCVAISCEAGSNKNGNSMYARAHLSHPTTSSCSRSGRKVTCEDLELLRFRVPLPGETQNSTPPDQGTVLVSQGSVLPGVSEIMTEMNVVQSSKTELIVSMPRSDYGP
ncbi:unnamed protein product [Echinostoma caproni]|uniref:MABP domain-containing protein n=1 Tax=Echinostoma caproni TaxID=27848 RepID=A0A183ASL4_9TREM|nr:unnamed protein product [Echinostoma caproni]